MAVITKFSGYFINANENNPEWGDSAVEYIFDRAKEGYAQQLHTESVSFEWDDELPINFSKCDLAECEKYFAPQCTKLFDRHVPLPGQKYRHFKAGKIVEIITLGKHSENPDAWLVVYSCSNGVWCRPLDMFMSEVDREKYPEATQKYRFELVE